MFINYTRERDSSSYMTIRNQEATRPRFSTLENTHEPPRSTVGNDFCVLVVDDDAELCRGLVELFRSEGYATDLAHDGEAGLTKARSGRHNLIILDVMMPKMNGLEMLRKLRPTVAIPVILLTARDADADRLLGLQSGADDYLAKPFNPQELLLRVQAILRRAQPTATATLVVGPLELDTLNHQARVGNSNLALTGAERRVLEALMRSPGKILSSEFLTQYALGRPLTPYDRSLHTHIRNLRNKIRPHHAGQTVIKNIRGAGYVLIPDWEPQS